MNMVPQKDQLRFEVAYDDWSNKGRRLPKDPAGRKGYVCHKGRWYLATSDGHCWIVNLDETSKP